MKIILKENLYLNGFHAKGEKIDVSAETYSTIKDIVKHEVIEQSTVPEKKKKNEDV